MAGLGKAGHGAAWQGKGANGSWWWFRE